MKLHCDFTKKIGCRHREKARKLQSAPPPPSFLLLVVVIVIIIVVVVVVRKNETS